MSPQISPGVSPPLPAAPHPMTGTNNESAPHQVTQIPGGPGPTQPQPRPACQHLQGARLPPLLPQAVTGCWGL